MTLLRIDWTSRALREAKRLDPPARQRIATALDAFVETERGDIVLLTDVTPPEYRYASAPGAYASASTARPAPWWYYASYPRGKAYR